MTRLARAPGGVVLASLLACSAQHGAPSTDPSSAGSSAAPRPAAQAPLQRVASADGVSIAWRAYGKGDTALVLIHGWALDSSVWHAQLPALSELYTVIALDLAGAGASSATRSRWSLALFAQDVAAVVAQVPAGQIILVGQGMGGPVALLAAPLVGPRLKGIIGIETFRTLGQPTWLPSQLDHALEPFQADFSGAVRRYVTATLFRSQADPVLVHATAEQMARASSAPALAALADLNRLDYGAVLAAVKVPIVAIDSDLTDPLDEGRLRQAAPQLRLVTLAGDDSFAMLDDARRLNATLLQAVATLAGP